MIISHNKQLIMVTENSFNKKYKLTLISSLTFGKTGSTVPLFVHVPHEDQLDAVLIRTGATHHWVNLEVSEIKQSA
jgi:hypothetical protein